MNTYKESIFTFTWKDGTTEMIIAHFDDSVESDKCKEYFKELCINYKLISTSTKNKLTTEEYPYFIIKYSGHYDKITNPSNKDLLFSGIVLTAQ